MLPVGILSPLPFATGEGEGFECLHLAFIARAGFASFGVTAIRVRLRD